MAVANIEEHRWIRREYERLAAKGFFPPGKRVELIEGHLRQVAAEQPPCDGYPVGPGSLAARVPAAVSPVARPEAAVAVGDLLP